MVETVDQIIGEEVPLNPKMCLLHIYPEEFVTSKKVFFEYLLSGGKTLYSLCMENLNNLCHSTMAEREFAFTLLWRK